MTDSLLDRNTIAPLRNVRALVTLVDKVMNRRLGMPGMATYYGYSGFGKSFSALFTANQFDAVYVEVREYWTVKKFLQSILIELGESPMRNVGDMAEQISKALLLRNVPLLIDEADLLIKKKGAIEIVRGIYEDSQVPVILIGEEEMPQKLQRWERVHGRMYDQVAAQPACMDDLDLLAKIYCPDIKIEPAFKAKLLSASHYSLRRLSVNLAQIEETANTHDVNVIDMDAWGKKEFQDIQAPAPRRNLQA